MMTPIEQLDYVLKFMVMSPAARGHMTDGQIECTINPREGGKISEVIAQDDLLPILGKLVLDGYLHREIPVPLSTNPIVNALNGIARYSVTWEGKCFLEQGGYEAQRKENIRIEEERENRYRAEEVRGKQMTNLTIILAAGTTVAALYYLAKGVLWLISRFGH
jgi:hypothetical protein